MNQKQIGLFVVMAVVSYITLHHMSKRIDLGASLGEENQKGDWIANTIAGVPVQVALNSVRTQTAERTLFLFVDAQDFTERNLQTLFTELSAQYSGPHDVSITAFSDKEMLRRAINEYLSPVVDYADTPDHERLAKEWAEKYFPLKTGYFRAYYTRSNGTEKYSYSPDPQKEDMNTVILKGKSALQDPGGLTK